MFTPGSFDPHSDKKPILRDSWRWSSLEEALRCSEATIMMMRLPLFWQVLSPAHAACMNSGCSFFVNDKDNMPLGEAATRVGGVDFALTDAKDAAAFSLYLAEKNASLKHWFVIYEPDEAWSVPIGLSDSNVTQEVHRSPGVPLLVQCERLSGKRDGSFHWAEGASAEAMASSINLEESSVCDCGKPTLRKK